MLGLKLIYVSKSGSWPPILNSYRDYIDPCGNETVLTIVHLVDKSVAATTNDRVHSEHIFPNNTEHANIQSHLYFVNWQYEIRCDEMNVPWIVLILIRSRIDYMRHKVKVIWLIEPWEKCSNFKCEISEHMLRHG